MTDLERTVRRETTCRGCGKPKFEGSILCWNCFKYIPDNFKWSGLSLEEWLENRKAKR